MNAQLYNEKGERAGLVTLPAAFDTGWNADLVHQVVLAERANRRRRIAQAKDRSEVRGGGRKPWRQKGTGRARHGSIRSPLWKGGGVTHGPRAERNFKKTVNQRMVRQALAAALSAKANAGELLVVAATAFEVRKTKEVFRLFTAIAKSSSLSDLTMKSRRMLVVLPRLAGGAGKAIANLPFARVADARTVSALDILNHKYVILTEDTPTLLAARVTTTA